MSKTAEKQSQVVHPATTILDHPELAQHVREIEESGEFSFVLQSTTCLLPS